MFDNRIEVISLGELHPQFLEKAYREAIVNAVVHRDYFDNGEVAVEKLKDKLIINNPRNSLVSKKEFGTTSRLRNRLIADLLSKTVFMEKVGTGIKRIKANCEKNKNKLEFKLAKNDFFVILKSEPLNEGVNEGVNLFFNYIKDNLGKRVPHFEKALTVPSKTIERWLNKLKKEDKIEFKGSPKTGRYWKIE